MPNLITVKTTADAGAGSLRAAIAAAQAGDTIRFAARLANKTISLTSGQLDVKKSLTIDAGKAAGLTISGNSTSRVFEMGAQTQVTLKNLTIANGKVSGNENTGAGGGILTGNLSQLTVINCRINKNVAGVGGGIYSGFRSTTTVINSSFDQNDGSLAGLERSGGAIALWVCSMLEILLLVVLPAPPKPPMPTKITNSAATRLSQPMKRFALAGKN